MMNPTPQWLAQWEKKRELLACPSDLDQYFTLADLQGRPLDVLDLGPVSVPTGAILVRDPLVYLQRGEQPYFLKVPTGEFQAEAAVLLPDLEDCARYAAVRVRFTPETALRYEEALIGDENLSELGEDMIYGFIVDAGMGCICDAAALDAYCGFAEEWERAHPENTLYDGYFADLFRGSYEAAPEYQCEDGDWLNWTVPGTDYHIPMFQSGYGDGVYPVYFGFDAEEHICQLVVQLIGLDGEDGI